MTYRPKSLTLGGVAEARRRLGRPMYLSMFAWQWVTFRSTFESGCTATGCRSRSAEECPEHGIRAFYARHAAAHTDSGD